MLSGDCIHTVKPYFGLGANSALEDVKVLSECLDYAGFRLDDSDGTTAAAGVTRTTSTISKAIREFTEKRAKDAKTLVRLSRELDRPGTLGFITFILPIILDSIFSSMAPSIFNPNTITMLQREDLTFGEVARMKRKDRALQVTILVSSMVGVAWCSNFLLRKVAKLTGLSPLVVGLATMIATGSISRLSKLIRKPSAPDETPKSVEVTSSQQTFIKPAFGKK